ncbi:MAG: penicillin-binding protein 2, partial [Paludibacteraceae bacterium]|nr:penicillin-binding protein 2 [Paludibacteraceae bacterium]
MIIVFIVYVLQLINLQILNPEYKQHADSNAFLKKTKFPARGLIYDRNGKLLVYNKPAYDVMVIMNEVQEFDTLDFCRATNITKEKLIKLIKRMKNERGYSKYTPQVLISQLSIEEFAILQEKLYKLPGFYIQDRTLREYTYPCAAHALGSVGEVSQRDMDNDPYYSRGDYAGKNGVEKYYEKTLRGEKGYEILLRDARGRLKGTYQDGKLDKASVPGKNIELSIDIDLQMYGE